jgi:GTP 3',8-cyclase
MLVDSFGRVATDLRVSLTDRCNLRCTYCMPPEGLDWLPSATLLTDDEVVRVVAIAVTEGVSEVRFTGGEPLSRRGLVDTVSRVSALIPRPITSITTNASVSPAWRTVSRKRASPASTSPWTRSSVSDSTS